MKDQEVEGEEGSNPFRLVIQFPKVDLGEANKDSLPLL